MTQAIWGILDLTGRTLSLDDMAGMPQGADIRQGAIALGHHPIGSMTNSSQAPRVYAGHLVSSHARLDNRIGLGQALGLSPLDQEELSNQKLISIAYAKWGVQCTDHLLGDWVFAIWDEKARHLFIARDQCGHSNLYYWLDHQQQRFAFSSVLRTLWGVPGLNRTVDLAHIALRFGADSLYTETPYQGVKRLPPGHRLILKDSSIDVRRYWNIHNLPSLRLASDEEYVEQFLAIYREAIHCRLVGTGSVGTFLSGGLDSGSMAIVAAKELALQGKRLPAFSAVSRFDATGLIPANRMGDETPLIKAIAAKAGNIDVAYLSSRQTTPLQGIEAIVDHADLPFFPPSNAYWFLDIFREARSQNMDVLLCADGGNTTISWAGNPSETMAVLRQDGNWTAILGELFLSLLRKGQQFGYLLTDREFGRWIGEKWRTSSDSPIRQSPLRSDFIAEHAFFSTEMEKHDAQLISHSSQARFVGRYLDQGVFTKTQSWAAFWGLELRDPTIDRRVIEFCLGIPRDQYARRGQSRLLIRRSMAGLMPVQTLWNRKKGLQSADIIRRVQASRQEIEEGLCRIEMSDLARHCLNIESMRDVFNSLDYKCNYTTTAATTNVLLRGLLIGLFLLTFEAK